MDKEPIIKLKGVEDKMLFQFRKKELKQSAGFGFLQFGKKFNKENILFKVQKIVNMMPQFDYQIHRSEPLLIKKDRKPTSEELIHFSNSNINLQSGINLYSKVQHKYPAYYILSKSMDFIIVCYDHVVFDGMGLIHMIGCLFDMEVGMNFNLQSAKGRYWKYLYLPKLIYKSMKLKPTKLIPDLNNQDLKYIVNKWNLKNIKEIKKTINRPFICCLMGLYYHKLMNNLGVDKMNIILINAFNDQTLHFRTNSVGYCIITITRYDDVVDMILNVEDQLKNNKYQFLLSRFINRYNYRASLKQDDEIENKETNNIVDGIFTTVPLTSEINDVTANMKYFGVYFAHLTSCIYTACFTIGDKLHISSNHRFTKLKKEYLEF